MRRISLEVFMGLFMIEYMTRANGGYDVCPIYTCGNLNPTLDYDPICAQYNNINATFLFQSCKESDQICNYTEWEKNIRTPLICSSPDPPSDLGAGEPCTNSLECHLEACRADGRCWGRENGGQCDSQLDCDPGYSCAPHGSCLPLPPIGHSCADTGGGTLCPLYGLCVLGYCQLKYSLPLGHLVGERNHLACASAYIGKLENESWVCMEGPKLVGYTGVPFRAPIDGVAKCNYTLAGEQISSISPTCGASERDSGFCIPGMGDNSEELKALQEYYELQIECNIEAGDFCLAASSINGMKYYKALAASLLLDMYPVLVDANYDCLKTISPWSKYYYAKEYDTIPNWVWWVVGAVGVLIVVLSVTL